MSIKKRLAVFLDGTTDDVGANTNVWRAKSLCADRDYTEIVQLKYYSSGVGVAISEKIRGGAIGYGIDNKIRDAYEWLVDQYQLGDDIFIFGFSRGAFTARSLAGLIAKCGILKSGSPLGVNELYDRYRNRPNALTIWDLNEQVTKNAELPLTSEDAWLVKYSQCAPIEMIGVWDTVGALGVPFGHWHEYSSKTFSSLHTGLRIPEKHAYHALAVDEHRKIFAATLWTKAIHHDGTPTAKPRPIEDVEQRWFIGTHGNVGGGYDSDILPQTSLRWILEKATHHGLAFKDQVEAERDFLTAEIPDSRAAFLGGWYRVFSPAFFRPIGAPPVESADKEDQTINETIDLSVFEKWRADPSYRPKNLREWAERLKINPEDIHNSVSANDGSPVS